MEWEGSQRFQVFLRRVCLEHGFTSEDIDTGRVTEADALLLLQPSDSVRSWVSEVFKDTEASKKQFDAFVKAGVMKEVSNG